MGIIDKLTNIADAIREKTGGTEKLSLDGMAEAIAGISAGGGDEQSALDSLIERSITEITSNVTEVGPYAFYNCNELTSADFPLATKIDLAAFNACPKLTSVNIPLGTSIGNNAFSNCNQLTSVNIPLATSIGAQAFQNCAFLASVNFPLATSLGNYALGSCFALISADFPLVTSLGQSAFSNCSRLTTVNFPSAKSLGQSAFNSCSQLTTVNFPLVEGELSQRAFYGCSSLPSVDFPLVTSIGAYAFAQCSSLKTVVLRSDKICSLSDTSAFLNNYHIHGTKNPIYNPNALKDGYFYVPKALIEDYKVATNWSTFATQFRALEDYTVDGTTTGALDESKI